ncbi:MAG TPA: hydrogenase maturation protease [Blastocatellia bacterium]|nr:hydrogenase maturation protease [Blastocatellia bacterium]
MEFNYRPEPDPVHIICYGNEWQGDDGFGMHVYRRLHRTPLFRTIPVFEGGIGGLNTIPYFENCRRAIIVDGVRSGANAGGLVVLSPHDIAASERVFTLHNYGVGQLLACLHLLFDGEPHRPEILFIGAEIGPSGTACTGFGNTLSDPLNRAAGLAVRVIYHRLRRFISASPQDLTAVWD